MKTKVSAIDVAVCRWVARIVGTLLVLLIVFLAIGEGMPNPFTQPIRVQFGFLALSLILVGILAGWRWELWGGIISLFGWFLFFVAVINSPRSLTGFVLALALPGVLYVASAILRRYHEKHPSA
jgi:hypothetical protein